MNTQNATHSLTRPFAHSTIYQILESVTDPEIPVISLTDLGIVREVKIQNNEVEVVITPTYTGCPAMFEMKKDIQHALRMAGVEKIKITTILSPAWTTAWMSEEGKRKLEKYGIAPPNPTCPDEISCPQCHSKNTALISQFGSTPCKALYKCENCLEPFDYFKCH